MRGVIWLGDLARALAAVDGFGDEDRRRAVARLLTPAPPAVPTGPPRPAEPATVAAAPTRRAPKAVAVPSSASRGQAEGPSADVPLLEPAGTEPTAAPPGWSVPPLPRPDAGLLALPPPHVPLLAPRSTGRLLQAAVSRKVPEGRLDVPKVVERIAAARPVIALPREPVPTLRFGVQVLVDLGTGMEPFARDQEDLLRQLSALAGAENVEVGYFEDAPTRGAGPGPPRTWRPYRAPFPGTQVLVLSDLGLGGPWDDPHSGTRQEWEEFADTVRRNGGEPVVFLPIPRRRWPGWARAALSLVRWDRGTTAGEVAASLR